MTLTRLSDRLETLPLVLSGPLLRRTEPTGVTVFVALRKQREVTLRIYEAAAGGARGALRAEGKRATVKLGAHLHAVAVTATPGTPLAWGGLYLYDLAFGAAEGSLLSPGALATEGDPKALVCYPTAGAPALPSFVLPPQDLNALRLLHGSCRKANGPGRDLLPLVDDLIAEQVANPLRRPHQLFLTGDQVYADDVPDALLALLTDAGNTLLGWTPNVPLDDPPNTSVAVPRLNDSATPPHLAPGGRQKLVEDEAHFTSTHAKSHLLTIAEFYAQYLFAWSDALWPAALPEFLDVYRTPDAYRMAWHEDITGAMKEFAGERRQVMQFRDTLRAVRRALANVPSYMMFDDHEVTDDWNIFLDWSEKVLGSSLGFHVLQNGLAAYAVFQGWGNTPDRFGPGTSGATLLQLLAALDPDPYSGVRMALRDHIGPPSAERVQQQKSVDHLAGELDWHYTVRGPAYEVIALDTRTWRSYDQGRKRPASMISAAGFKRQLPLNGEPGYVAPPGADGLTLILAPGPVLDSDWYELGKNAGSYVGLRHIADVENWRHALLAYERLFSRAFRRRSRLVLLSGDVHYGFSARLAYWARRPYEAPAPTPELVRGVAAQVTSSALRNGWGPGFSRRGYMRWDSLPAPAHYGGWHSAPRVYVTQRHFRRPHSRPPVAEVDKAVAVSAAPDWRYRVDYVLAERDTSRSYAITAPASWNEPRSQATFRDALSRYLDFLGEHGAGKEIVGENNLGELTLAWQADKQVLTHTLWWRLTEPLKPFGHSVFKIPLTPEPEPPAIPVP